MKKMKYTALVLLGFFIFGTVPAQNLNELLDQILQNNPQLKLAEKTTERMKLESSIGLLPPDPEIEFGYLWGDPSSIGIRKDFGISQHFEFPSVYAQRARYSRMQQSLSDYYYQNAKQQITAEVLRLMIAIIYQNKLMQTLEKRLEDALKVKRMTNQLLDEGEVGILDKDKADLQYLNLENQVELCRVAIETLTTDLSRMNGNKPVKVSDVEYPDFFKIEDVEKLRTLYFERDAATLMLKNEQKISQQQLKLSSHEYLPEFSIAYASESILDEKLGGIKAGISIPLWHKKNTIKLSKISVAEKEAEILQFSLNKNAQWNRLWTQYSNYQKRVEEMKTLLDRIVPCNSLLMAFQLGEISLLDFITESSFYYDSYDNYLELEKESYLKAVELKKVELAL